MDVQHHLELGGIRHPAGGAGLFVHRRLVQEVLDMGPVDHRAALGRRLHHVLPAVWNQAAADEDDVRQAIQALQLADRVDDEHGIGAAIGHCRAQER